MAITTSIAPSYGWRMLFIAALCAVFGVWGAYDYWVKIPRQERDFAEYTQAKDTITEIDRRQGELRPGQQLSDGDIMAHRQANQTIARLAPGGEAPTKPSKFNRVTQWFYIACFPFTFYCLWLYAKAKKQVFRLDDEGTLHFEGDPEHGSGAWQATDIADIDMSRWMAKSIAYLVRAGDDGGVRLKLDAYLHKDLHLIVGAIAARHHPDKWDSDAKPVKARAIEPPSEPAPADEAAV